MKKIFFLLISIFGISTYSYAFIICQDSPTLDYIGYNNCNGATNGEHLIISHFIKDCYTVFDIGAAIGEWSLKSLSSASQLMLYAFEPIPETYAHLKKNLSPHNVNIFNIAISSMSGQRTIAHYDQSLAWAELSSFYRRKEVECSCKVNPKLIDVPTCDLDTFCLENKIEKIDFLKIDTEGSELDILKGAISLLSNKKVTYLQFEYGGTYFDVHTTLKEVYELLTHAGYNVYRIVPNGLIKISTWRDSLENYCYSNYFASLLTI